MSAGERSNGRKGMSKREIKEARRRRQNLYRDIVNYEKRRGHIQSAIAVRRIVSVPRALFALSGKEIKSSHFSGRHIIDEQAC